ncbi:alkylated DNA repair protein alkB [Yasminevirus sp. GU-2018]|uniref:Alkylated DNA repair protein alkB n=1 Tax=Yasminevirus sp. GU-2018 TaxID=2420051 RepID=A0A5K0U931_9VIRU|nr:alkylated DNA repair protein alkB [Yasminevirus sp. GU-2018]
MTDTTDTSGDTITETVRAVSYRDSPLNSLHGLHLFDDIMNVDTEQELLKYINSIIQAKSETVTGDASTKPSNMEVKSRTCIHFGHVFDPVTLKVATSPNENNDSKNTTSSKTTIPQMLRSVVSDIFNKSGLDLLKSWSYDQITINQYSSERKSGIGSHVDTHSVFDDLIVVISLGAPTVLRFDLPDPRTTPIDQSVKSRVLYNPDPVLPIRVDLWVKPRSLLIMSGMSRYLYKHRIQVRRFDVDPEGSTIKREVRTSITIRKVRTDGKCECSYPVMCDYQNPASLHVPDRLGK